MTRNMGARRASGGLSRIKRATWCRVFHRWHRRPYGGWGRTFCGACEDWESPLD